MRCLFYTLVLACVGLAGFSAEAADTFKSFFFQVPGRVNDLIIEDLDEDGLLDIFTTHVEGDYPNYTRGMTVFFQSAEGFSEKSRQTITVGPSVALVDLGQVDGEPGKDIAAICKGNVSYYPLRGRKYGTLTRFVSARPFTAFADDDVMPYYDFLQDWNGDGHDELLLMEFDRSLVYPTGEHGLSSEGQEILLTAQVSITIGGPERIFQEHHSLRAFYWMPQLNAVDFDGDGRVDLIGSYQAKLTVFKQLPDGSFSREPSQEIQLHLPKVKKEGEKKRGEQAPPMVIVEDVNRDGKADVIASQLVGGFGDLQSQTFIYYGQTGSLQKNQYDQKIQMDNAGSFPLLRDLDGDGKLDLIIPYVNIDILSIAKMIITSSLDVRFNMYVLNRQNRYPDEPTGQDTTSIKVNFKELTVEGGVPNVDGDFDGDGQNDVVVGKNVEEIQVMKGIGNGSFLDDPMAVIAVAAPLFPDVADLDHNGFADVVVSYLPFTDDDHKIYIFLNNGNLARAANPGTKPTH